MIASIQQPLYWPTLVASTFKRGVPRFYTRMSFWLAHLVSILALLAGLKRHVVPFP